jgi:DNA repair protein RadC
MSTPPIIYRWKLPPPFSYRIRKSRPVGNCKMIAARSSLWKRDNQCLTQKSKIMNTIAEIQISYSSHIKKEDRKAIKSSDDAYSVFLEIWNKETIEIQEECKALLLNRANEVLGVLHLSRGGIAGTVVDVKLLLAATIKSGASGILLAHNHPTGNLTPSKHDKTITEKLKTACKYLDIVLLDHIIITKENFVSIKN